MGRRIWGGSAWRQSTPRNAKGSLMWERLDPRGRCNNAEYVLAALIGMAAAAPLVLSLALDGIPTLVRHVAIGGLWFVTGVMWLVAVRRAHDEGYSAREAHAWMGGPTLLLLVWITLPGLGLTPPNWALLITFAVAALWCYVGLYVVAQAGGSANPNRFGPPTIHRRSGQTSSLNRSGRS